MKKNASKKDRQRELLREMLIAGRERAGIKQVDLSLKMGVVQSYIAKIELGDRGMDVPEFIEMAQALNLDPAELITDLIRISNEQEENQEENIKKAQLLRQLLSYIEKLVQNDGPDPDEYENFRNWSLWIARALKTKDLTYQDIQTIRAAFGDALSLETLWGWTLHKPHDYAGDYELIDKIQRRFISQNSLYSKWDENFQETATATAIRDRKNYLVKILRELSESEDLQNVLIIGLGAANDLYEFFSSQSSNVVIDAVEPEQEAIDHAAELCREYLPQINFFRSNAFRFKPSKKYNLIWSADLLDKYDGDKASTLLKRLSSFLAPSGQLVMSNLADSDPGRQQMEILGYWELYRRNERNLRALCSKAGVYSYYVENIGGNYFLHTRN